MDHLLKGRFIFGISPGALGRTLKRLASVALIATRCLPKPSATSLIFGKANRRTTSKANTGRSLPRKP